MASTTFSANQAERPISLGSKPDFLIIHEYNFYAEALPITLVGILLNVAGRQIASFLGLEVFLDMIGTAFTAIILGPWWAAATAAATTLANGSFFETYFPFGAVNVAGGLVWGYLARAGNVRCSVFSSQQGSLRAGLIWTIVLILAGALTTGLASSLVKLIIYPAVERPLVHGDLYLRIQASFEPFFGAGVPPALTLMAGDLFRDLRDKSIVVPVAVLLAAFSRVGGVLGEGSKGASLGERIRTDVLSILIFLGTYSTFLLLSELLQPVITYPSAQRSIAWLHNASIVLLMCSPLLAAIPALILATFRPSGSFARKVHALREFRRYVFRNIFRAKDSLLSLVSSQGIKPLGLGVSLWSARNVFDTKYISYFALVAIGITLVIYFIASRRTFAILTRAERQFRTVHNWLEVEGAQGSDRAIVSLMRDLFSSYLSRPGRDLSTRNQLLYGLAFASSRPPGGIENLLIGRREDLFFEPAAIIGVVKEPKALTLELVEQVDGLVADCGANLAIVLSSTPRLLDERIVDSLRDIRSRGVEVLLLDWIDLSLAISECALGIQPKHAVQRAKARLLQTLNRNDPLEEKEFSSRPAELAHRALPSVRFIIDLLPKQSRVFDLGCGRGRHTFVALQAGHRVVAADRKPSICEGLRSDLSTLGPDGKRVEVVEGDFLKVTASEYGAADLVIVTGVLQHARSREELYRYLEHIADLARHPTSLIYIEMLFDMKFNGMPPQDGRIPIAPGEFVRALREIFPREHWRLEKTQGPIRQKQYFDQGGRSFEPPAGVIESTAIEYVIRRVH